MERLDLSRRKEPKPEIRLDDVGEFFEELATEAPVQKKVEKKTKKVEVKEHSKKLNNMLSLKREEPIPALAPEEFISTFTEAIAPEGFEMPVLEPIVVEDTPSPVAPEDYKVEEVEVGDIDEPLSATAPEGFVAPPKTVEVKQVTYTSTIVPENYDPELGIQEEEKPFQYDIPEGYDYVVEEVKKEEAVIKEEAEEVEEEVIEEPKSDIQILADKVASISPSPKDVQEITKEALLENKILNLEKTLADTRRLVMEMTHGTLVSGMGNAGGGGEVNLKFLDDVSVNNIQDGDALVWDATLQQFIPGTAGGAADISTLNRSVSRLQEKFISMDERIQNFLNTDTKLLKLEDNTTELGSRVSRESREFIDETADGDTTTFVVTQDNRRNVYELDGIPQPTVQVPRGDVIIFNISGLSDPSSFDVYQNGVVLQTGYTRDNTPGSESITIATASVDSQYDKLYYRHTTINGLGWIIQITDN